MFFMAEPPHVHVDVAIGPEAHQVQNGKDTEKFQNSFGFGIVPMQNKEIFHSL